MFRTSGLNHRHSTTHDSARDPTLRNDDVVPDSAEHARTLTHMTCLRLLPSIRLYQYAICPFCHKSKALLNYIGLEHDIVEVNPLTKAELPKTDYRKVPIALIDQQQVNGSDEIVQSLLENQRVQEKLKLDKWKDTGMTLDLFQGNDDDNQRKWMQFARERVATTLYPNICRTMGDSYESFGYVNDVSSWSTLQKMYVRTIGSFAMYMAASRIKSKSRAYW